MCFFGVIQTIYIIKLIRLSIFIDKVYNYRNDDERKLLNVEKNFDNISCIG